jgi:predicted alpha/beta superfamily hydrolase
MTGSTRYSIVGTETRLIKSTFVDQEFQISIALPVFHSREPDKKCPVIYLLDSNFYFGMVTEMTPYPAKTSSQLDYSRESAFDIYFQYLLK